MFKPGDLIVYCPIKCKNSGIKPEVLNYVFEVLGYKDGNSGELKVHSVVRKYHWNIYTAGDYFGNGTPKYWKKVKTTKSGKVSINE